MKKARVRYIESTDVVASYELEENGVVLATFPSAGAPGTEQAVEVQLNIGPGRHTFDLVGVASDGTRSPDSQPVTAVFPVAAPSLLAVEPV
jgi:hypothetical protein